MDGAATIVHEKEQPFAVEEVELEEPCANECRVAKVRGGVPIELVGPLAR